MGFFTVANLSKYVTIVCSVKICQIFTVANLSHVILISWWN